MVSFYSVQIFLEPFCSLVTFDLAFFASLTLPLLCLPARFHLLLSIYSCCWILGGLVGGFLSSQGEMNNANYFAATKLKELCSFRFNSLLLHLPPCSEVASFDRLLCLCFSLTAECIDGSNLLKHILIS